MRRVKNLTYEAPLLSGVLSASRSKGNTRGVLEYIGRYTHRVAISNSRILKVENGKVTFRYLDREDGYKKKEETISGVAFLECFLEHIMTPYYRRIRHFWFLANRKKKKNSATIRAQFGVKIEEIAKRTRAEILKKLGVKNHFCIVNIVVVLWSL